MDMENIENKVNTENQSAEQSAKPVKKDSGIGPGIGSLIIIIVILIGGLYYLDSLKSSIKEQSNSEEQENVNSDLSESNDVEDLEDDLDSTDVNNLDEDFAEIEAEIDAAFQE